MAPPKLRALLTSLLLVGATTLTAAASARAVPAQPAAVTAPVVVTIGAHRAVSMPTLVQPGVNEFHITSAAKGGSAFQLALPAADYTTAEAQRDIEKAFEQGKMRQLRRFEANVTLLGGVYATDKAATLVVDLDPGTYWALDIAGQDNKFFAFAVSGVDTGNVMPSAPTLKAKQATTWARSPKSIPNKGLLTFKNASSNNHFIELAQLKKGKTYQDFKAWFAAIQQGSGGPEPFTDTSLDTGVLSPGHSAVLSYRLPKGDYVLFCFWPDASMGGMEHAFMGMHRAITLN